MTYKTSKLTTCIVCECKSHSHYLESAGFLLWRESRTLLHNKPLLTTWRLWHSTEMFGCVTWPGWIPLQLSSSLGEKGNVVRYLLESNSWVLGI